MATEKSPGQVVAEILSDSLSAYKMGPVVGDHPRQIIWGVTPDGSFVDGMTLDGFIAQAIQILRNSGCVYRYGNSIVYETNAPGDQRLTTLAVQQRAEPIAASVLANRFGVGFETKQGAVQSLAASKLIGAVLADESLCQHIPEITYYARRPTFDLDFNLCQPSWNATSGILVHAPEVVPSFYNSDDAPQAKTIDRLPPRLKGLFGEFSWRSDADMVNALAMLLTGLLVNHFIDDPHPGGIVDANQPGTGKTLYVQVAGRILDGVEPPRTSLVRDEEVEKRLCAQLRRSRSSVYFLDNVRVRIESAVLEQNMLSPLLSFRILGKSDTIERPNGYLWFITSNMTAATTDFIRRCVPIRQFFEGDPKARVFKGNPLAYASKHRLGILGELAGMVLRWVQQGKPLGSQKHRCDRWAATIGGILDANGLGKFFLANADEAEAQMDQGLVDLTTLAEHIVNKGLTDLHGPAGGSGDGKGRSSSQWVPLFAETLILRDKFVDASPKGKSTAVGMFLSGKVNRAVPIETSDGSRTATLHRRDVAAGQKLYYFEIALPSPTHGPAAPSPPGTVEAPLPIVPGGGSALSSPASGVVQADGGSSAVSPLPPVPTQVSVASNGAPVGSDPEWL